MTEPTTPRGIAIVDASREIGRAAENAGIAYERGEDLRCSNDERAETEARVELTRLVCEMEADLARVTAERDAALASRDEWRGVADLVAGAEAAECRLHNELEGVKRERDAARENLALLKSLYSDNVHALRRAVRELLNNGEYDSDDAMTIAKDALTLTDSSPF